MTKRPIKVTIIDDENDLRQSIAAFINGTPGFRCVSTYASGEDALKHLPQDEPDVVLMDIHMAGMNGIECAVKLRAALPKIQILMLTVYEDTELIFKALSAGASGYILKRLTPAKLLEAIEDVHSGGSPMSGTIARKVVASFQKVRQVNEEKFNLSPREQMVLDSLARGFTYKQTADELGISVDTIRTYIRRIYEKLHVQSRTEAVAKYVRN